MSIFWRKKSNFDIIPKPSHKENFSFLISPFFTIVFIYLIGKGNPSVRKYFLSEIQKYEKKPETYRAYSTNSHTVP